MHPGTRQHHRIPFSVHTIFIVENERPVVIVLQESISVIIMLVCDIYKKCGGAEVCVHSIHNTQYTITALHIIYI